MRIGRVALLVLLCAPAQAASPEQVRIIEMFVRARAASGICRQIVVDDERLERARESAGVSDEDLSLVGPNHGVIENFLSSVSAEVSVDRDLFCRVVWRQYGESDAGILSRR